MDKMKLNIAGPMSGYPWELVKLLFDTAADYARDQFNAVVYNRTVTKTN